MSQKDTDVNQSLKRLYSALANVDKSLKDCKQASEQYLSLSEQRSGNSETTVPVMEEYLRNRRASRDEYKRSRQLILAKNKSEQSNGNENSNLSQGSSLNPAFNRSSN